jgi:hypothetical protein
MIRDVSFDANIAYMHTYICATNNALNVPVSPVREKLTLDFKGRPM